MHCCKRLQLWEKESRRQTACYSSIYPIPLCELVSSNIAWDRKAAITLDFPLISFCQTRNINAAKTHSLLQMWISAMIEDSENQRIPVWHEFSDSSHSMLLCKWGWNKEGLLSWFYLWDSICEILSAHSLQWWADATLACTDDTDWKSALGDVTKRTETYWQHP